MQAPINLEKLEQKVKEKLYFDLYSNAIRFKLDLTLLKSQQLTLKDDIKKENMKAMEDKIQELTVLK